MTSAFTAQYTLEYDYRRTLGPAAGAFIAALGAQRLLGARGASGEVVAPATDYHPVSGEALTELVDVGPAGTVTTWSWVTSPRPRHPLDHPFAWALIRLDGADTAMLHAVDAGSPEAMRPGLRVRPRWSPSATGALSDLACFEPGDAPPARPAPPPAPQVKAPTPVRLDYHIIAGPARSRFLQGILEGRILGAACPRCDKVYAPLIHACRACAAPLVEPREVGPNGTVTTFSVVRIPFEGQQIQPPYVLGWILLDGADIPLLHIVSGVPADEVRMGLRVEPLWCDPDDREPTLESIRYFRPSGEPDAPFASYEGHL